MDGGRIDRGCVGAGLEHAADIVDGADAATYGQGHEDTFGGPSDNIDDDVAFIGRCGNVQEGQFVGTLLVIHLGNLDRITGVTQFQELHAFDNPATFDVQTGNDAFGQHIRPVLW